MTGQTHDIHPELMEILVEIELRLQQSLTITSGYRTVAHNASAAVGGVEGSEHTKFPAEGVDVMVLRSVTRFKIVKYALELGIRRIGIGETFVHLGISHEHPRDVLWTYYKPEPADGATPVTKET